MMKLLILKLLIILVPSYAAAFLTDKMVYVIPTLAACILVASSLDKREDEKQHSVDEDGSSGIGYDGSS